MESEVRRTRLYNTPCFQMFSRNPPDNNQSLLQGGMLVDPVFSNEDVQFAIPTYNFVRKNQKLLNFTNDDVAKVKEESDRCNLTNFTLRNIGSFHLTQLDIKKKLTKHGFGVMARSQVCGMFKVINWSSHRCEYS